MEKEGYVSLWIGDVLSDEMLEEYLEVGYDDDGNGEKSAFLQDYEIELYDFDEDFAERIFCDEKTEELSKLLEGCSYEEIILPKFNELFSQNENEKFNSAILLYNFEYKGNVKMYEQENCKFEFIGLVQYEE